MMIIIKPKVCITDGLSAGSQLEAGKTWIKAIKWYKIMKTWLTYRVMLPIMDLRGGI